MRTGTVLDLVPTPPGTLLAAADGGGGGGSFGALPLFLLIGLAFYFLIVRPQRNRAREAQAVRSSLEVGAEVMTTAGLFGRVAQVDDDTVLLEVAPGVTNKYAKAAIARIVPVAEPERGPEEDPLPDEGSSP